MGAILATPVLSCRALDEEVGMECLLKAENLQETGAFKVRGALSALSRLPGSVDVVTASAGNFGQGVAFGASRGGRRSLVLVPEGTPEVKQRRIERFGGVVRVAGQNFDETYALARQTALQEGKVFLPPFDDRRVIEGQGTGEQLVPCGAGQKAPAAAGHELLAEVRRLDLLLVPCGGGGLLAGAVLAARDACPDLRIVAAEPASLPSLGAAMPSGRPTRLPAGRTLADGVAVREVGRLPMKIVRRHVDAVLPVSESAIRRAIRFLALEAKQTVEGAGAVATAALLEHHATAEVFRGCRRIGILVTGGNIDPAVLGAVLGGEDDA